MTLAVDWDVKNQTKKKYSYVLHSLDVFALTLCKLIIFESSLDKDQARQNGRSDLGPNCLTM